MKRRKVVAFLPGMLLATSGCRSFQAEAALRRPAELTAAAAAGVAHLTPTPAPHLGKLAYLQGGDVWIKALPDGTPHRRTTDGRNHVPLWSTSGEYLAYSKDFGSSPFRTLWIVPAADFNAPSRSVGVIRADMDGQYAWDPRLGDAGDRLAFVENGGLVIVGHDGSDRRELIARSSAPESGVETVAWSGNGIWLAFQRTERVAKAEADGLIHYTTLADGIWRVRPDGSELSQIYANPNRAATRISLQGWSPGGQQILAWRYPTSASLAMDEVSLEAIAAWGGAMVTVAAPMIERPDFVAWSPLGQQLAFVRGAGRWTWYARTIAVTTLGGTARVLTAPDRVALDPAWSPGGKQIAFVSQAAHPDDAGSDLAQLTKERAIWLMRSDGSAQQALTGHPTTRDERPLWSSDGQSILFARIQDQRAQLWLMRADGSAQRSVVDELTPSPLAWDDYGSIPWNRAYDWWMSSPRASSIA